MRNSCIVYDILISARWPSPYEATVLMHDSIYSHCAKLNHLATCIVAAEARYWETIVWIMTMTKRYWTVRFQEFFIALEW